jgi:hypothetical protein
VLPARGPHKPRNLPNSLFFFPEFRAAGLTILASGRKERKL